MTAAESGNLRTCASWLRRGSWRARGHADVRGTRGAACGGSAAGRRARPGDRLAGRPGAGCRSAAAAGGARGARDPGQPGGLARRTSRRGLGRPAAGQRRGRHLHLRGRAAPGHRAGPAASRPGPVATGAGQDDRLRRRRLPAQARGRRPRRGPLLALPGRGPRAAGGVRSRRRAAGGGRGAGALAGTALRRGARPVRRGRAAAAHRAAHDRDRGAGRADAGPGTGGRGGARADRAGGRAPAPRAGHRAADDRAVPVRQAGRGAARLRRDQEAAGRGPRHRPRRRADQDPPAAAGDGPGPRRAGDGAAGHDRRRAGRSRIPERRRRR